MEVHNLKRYKESKTILPHLEQILRVLELTEQSLTYFKSYIPVAKLLLNIKEQKKILEGYRNKYKEIKKTKGRYR